MVNQEVLNWVKTKLAEGSTEQELRNVLLKQYSEDIVNEVFSEITQPAVIPAAPQASSVNSGLAQASANIAQAEGSSSMLLTILAGAAFGLAILIILYFVFVSGGSNKVVVDDSGKEKLAEEVVEETVVEGIHFEWSEFEMMLDSFDREKWTIITSITNSQEEDVVLEFYGKNPGGNWHFEGYHAVEPGETYEILFGIPYLGKSNITIYAYECSKLIEAHKEFLCKTVVGKSLSDVIEERKMVDPPITPTATYVKYFNYKKEETPPQEISAAEYEK